MANDVTGDRPPRLGPEEKQGQKWLVAALKRGKKLDSFLIDKSARKGRKKRRAKR
jgi:hypothetical protein